MSDPGIDSFIDALWLEEGLSRNTLAAYRRDLSLYAHWLAQRERTLAESSEADLNGYFAARHSRQLMNVGQRCQTQIQAFEIHLGDEFDLGEVLGERPTHRRKIRIIQVAQNPVSLLHQSLRSAGVAFNQQALIRQLQQILSFSQ